MNFLLPFITLLAVLSGVGNKKYTVLHFNCRPILKNIIALKY